jgi:hypothetical protein
MGRMEGATASEPVFSSDIESGVQTPRLPQDLETLFVAQPELLDRLSLESEQNPVVQGDLLGVAIKRRLEAWKTRIVAGHEQLRRRLWSSVGARLTSLDCQPWQIQSEPELLACWGHALDLIHCLDQSLEGPYPSLKVLGIQGARAIRPAPEPLLLFCFLLAVEDSAHNSKVAWEFTGGCLRIQILGQSELSKYQAYLHTRNIDVRTIDGFIVFAF